MKMKLKQLCSLSLICVLITSSTNLVQAINTKNTSNELNAKVIETSEDSTILNFEEVYEDNQMKEETLEAVNQQEQATEDSTDIVTINQNNETKIKDETVNIKETNSLNEFSNNIADLCIDDELTNINTYSTKRLLVLSDEPNFDTVGAISIINFENLYVLSYETEDKTKEAYHSLKENNSILSVEIDSIIETNTIDTNLTENTDKVEYYTELNEFISENKSNYEVQVAILDTGFYSSEEIFNNKIFDLNTNLSSSGEENSITDDNGHGTDIAKVITKNTNENIKLMPIKIANNEGKSTILSTYLGIQKAIENKADIINISLGTISSSSSNLLTSIINESTKNGTIFVVAAGNNNSNVINYSPANIESAITVSSVDLDGNITSFSNYGKGIDYCSYGENGTSIATANVSSIIALIKSIYPNYNLDDIKTLLNEYVIELGEEGFDEYYGNGLLALTVTDSLKPQNTITKKETFSILDYKNWKELSDEEFNYILFYSEKYDVGKFLSELNETDFKLALDKSEYLTNESMMSNFDENGNLINETSILCYEDCINEFNLYKEEIQTFGYGNPGNANAKFGATSATIYVTISTTDGKINSRNKVVIKGKSNSNLSNYSIWLNGGDALTGLSMTTTESHTGNDTSFSATNASSFGIYLTGDIKDSYDKSKYVRQAGVQFVINYTKPTGYQFNNISNNTPCATFAGLDSNGKGTANGKTVPLWKYNGNGTSTFDGAPENNNKSSNFNATNPSINVVGDLQACISKGSGSISIIYKPIQYKQVVKVRYQNANGSWGAYGDVINANYNYGSTVSWSRGEDTYYQAASISYTVTGASTKYVDVYRKTSSHILYVRYQDVNGNWGTYNAVINQGFYNGATISWSRGADATYKAASISYVATSNSTNYLNVYRNTHTVNVNKGIGIASVSGNGTYYYGASATISASLLTGYHWVNWTGSSTYTNMSNIVSINGNKSFTANAAINTSNLVINPNGGTWNNNSNTQTFKQNYNTTKSIPIPIKTGYTFTSWTRTNNYGKLSSTTNNATYTFGANHNVTDTLTANWKINQYPVTYIDVVDSINGKVLNTTTKQINYNTQVRGADLGSNTNDNIYYNGYYYVSDTSATVGTSGVTIYRIFKLRTITLSGNIIWEDWNNKNNSRPNNVTLYIYGSDGKKYSYTIIGVNSQNTTINNWSYSKILAKYNSNGEVIIYTVGQEKAISQEEGLAYKDPIISGYNITNKISTDPNEIPSIKPTITVTAYIEWFDNNNYYGFRLDEVDIYLLQNGKIVETVSTSKNSYTFNNQYKYDKNGDLYEYRIDSDEVDRYSKSIEDELYTITYTFQEPTFKVVIPKKITLDGNTGKGEYKVSVQGNIDDRDSVNVIPDSSFIMKDNFFGKMETSVTQDITTFTNKHNLSKGTTSKLNIKTPGYAGLWKGNFHFNIYFEFGN